jgi:hypothetical protein
MSNASQFFGGGGVKPTGLINGVSALTSQLGFSGVTYTNNFLNAGCRQVVTGALTAGVLSTVLSLSGKGSLSHLSCSSVTVTARTHRLKVTVDGIVIFDASIATGATVNPVNAIGGAYVHNDSTNGVYLLLPLMVEYLFDVSLLIEYSSSLTETAQTNIFYRYVPR